MRITATMMKTMLIDGHFPSGCVAIRSSGDWHFCGGKLANLDNLHLFEFWIPDSQDAQGEEE